MLFRLSLLTLTTSQDNQCIELKIVHSSCFEGCRIIHMLLTNIIIFINPHHLLS